MHPNTLATVINDKFEVLNDNSEVIEVNLRVTEEAVAKVNAMQKARF